MDRRTFVKGSAAVVGATTLPQRVYAQAAAARQAALRLCDHAVGPACAGRGLHHHLGLQALAEARERCRRHRAEEVQQEGADRARQLRRPGQAGRVAQAHRAADPAGQGGYGAEPVRQPHEPRVGADHQQGRVSGDHDDGDHEQDLRAGTEVAVRVLEHRAAQGVERGAVQGARRPEEAGQDQGPRCDRTPDGGVRRGEQRGVPCRGEEGRARGRVHQELPVRRRGPAAADPRGDGDQSGRLPRLQLSARHVHADRADADRGVQSAGHVCGDRRRVPDLQGQVRQQGQRHPGLRPRRS